MASVRVGTSYATLAGGMARPSISRPSIVRRAEVLLTWLERVRQRRHLGQLSDHMLKDIGLSRADVERETAKPFWRP
jgi:uncharacterized protein YjiS (DUF1127 family)